MKLMHLENFPLTTGFEPGTSRTPGEDANPLPQSPQHKALCGKGLESSPGVREVPGSKPVVGGKCSKCMSFILISNEN